MSTNTYDVRRPSRRVVTTVIALVALAAAIAVTLWLTLAPASSSDSKVTGPGTAPQPSTALPSAFLGGGGHMVAK